MTVVVVKFEQKALIHRLSHFTYANQLLCLNIVTVLDVFVSS